MNGGPELSGDPRPFLSRETTPFGRWPTIRRRLGYPATLVALNGAVAPLPARDKDSQDRKTATAVHQVHVIVIIGENRGFDNLFAI